MKTTISGNLFPHDCLKRVRFDFRNFIREALANFTFTPQNDQFVIRCSHSSAQWLARPDGDRYKFELIREMD